MADEQEFRFDAVLLCEDVTQETARKIQEKLGGELIEVKVDGLLYELSVEQLSDPWSE